MEFCEGVSKSFVGGEHPYLATKWEKGTTTRSKAKLLIAVNKLPEWSNAIGSGCLVFDSTNAHFAHTTVQNAYYGYKRRQNYV